MSIRHACRHILVVAAIVCPSAAHAQTQNPRQVQPERPTVATHAHTVAPGYIEIEAGIQGDHIAKQRLWSAPTVTKIGLASHLQLNVSVPYTFSSGSNSISGIGDIGLGLKWRVLDDNQLLGDFAVLPTLAGLSGDHDVGLTLISSRDVSGVAVDLNATYTRLGAGTSHAASSALWTASFGFSLMERLGWVAEVFGSPSIGAGSGAPTVSFLTGPTYLIVPELGVDAGIIAPVFGGAPSALYVGLVWNTGRVFGSASPAALSSVPAQRAR